MTFKDQKTSSFFSLKTSAILRNMKIKSWPFLFVIPVLLTACGNAPRGLVLIPQNGDIYSASEPTVGDVMTNYVRHTDSVEVLSLIDNNEPLIFYVGSESCSGCRAFKPNLLRYVYETKALVYYLNVANNDDYLEYSKIWQRYQDMFIADLAVPYLTIIENSNSYVKGAVSKMTATTYEPFGNMMNQLVKVTNVSSLKTYEAASHYLSLEKALYFFYDRNNEEVASIYRDKILPLAEKSLQTLYVVDFATFDETSQASLRETFSLGETIEAVAQYYENGVLVEPHLFGLDDTSDQLFLETYL